jgi:hypothetical protein
MPNLESVAGVFDAQQMFFIATDAVTGASEKSSLLNFGTPPGGMAVRINIPSGSIPTTEDNDLTITVHGSATEDGAIIDGTENFELILKEDTMTPIGDIEAQLNFQLPIEAAWIVFTITQALGPDTLTGLVAGLITGHKTGQWDRTSPWETTKSIPA